MFGVFEGGVPREPAGDDLARGGGDAVAALPPCGLVNAAASGSGALGVLTGIGTGAKIEPGGGVFFFAKAGGPEELTWLGAGVVEAEAGDVALGFIFGGEAEVFVRGNVTGMEFGEQVPGEVVLVEALHDDDAAGEARVVGAGGQGGVVDFVDLGAHDGTIGVLGFEGVVDDEDVGAFAGDGGVEAEGEAVTGFVVFVAVFGVLVWGQGEDVPKIGAVPGAEEDAAAFVGVTDGDWLGI